METENYKIKNNFKFKHCSSKRNLKIGANPCISPASVATLAVFLSNTAIGSYRYRTAEFLFCNFEVGFCRLFYLIKLLKSL